MSVASWIALVVLSHFAGSCVGALLHLENIKTDDHMYDNIDRINRYCFKWGWLSVFIRVKLL